MVADRAAQASLGGRYAAHCLRLANCHRGGHQAAPRAETDGMSGYASVNSVVGYITDAMGTQIERGLGSFVNDAASAPGRQLASRVTGPRSAEPRLTRVCRREQIWHAAAWANGVRYSKLISPVVPS